MQYDNYIFKLVVVSYSGYAQYTATGPYNHESLMTLSDV